MLMCVVCETLKIKFGLKTVKYIYIMLFAVFLLIGCTAEDNVWGLTDTDGASTKITFSVNVPAYQVATRATVNDENTINQLWLLIFDENGNYLYKTQATAVTPSNGTFSATLTTSDKKRIIHFVANYDCSVIVDAVAKQKDERELISAMNVTGNQLTMWSRMEFTSITSNTTGVSVDLLRNMAKITVIDSNSKDRFSITGFSVHRMPTKGTVATFDTPYIFFYHRCDYRTRRQYIHSFNSYRCYAHSNRNSHHTCRHTAFKQ